MIGVLRRTLEVLLNSPSQDSNHPDDLLILSQKGQLSRNSHLTNGKLLSMHS